MRIRSYGAQCAKRGAATWIVSDEDMTLRPVVAKNGTNVRMWVMGKRRVEITMSPSEVITWLLALPPACIEGAVSKVETELHRSIPEVLKQLAAGAINTKAPVKT